MASLIVVDEQGRKQADVQIHLQLSRDFLLPKGWKLSFIDSRSVKYEYVAPFLERLIVSGLAYARIESVGGSYSIRIESFSAEDYNTMVVIIQMITSGQKRLFCEPHACSFIDGVRADFKRLRVFWKNFNVRRAFYALTRRK